MSRIKRAAAMGLVAAGLAVPAPALAQYTGPEGTVPTSTTAPTVLPNVENRESPQPKVQAHNADRAPQGRLPVTGADVMGLVAIGLASAATGTVLVRRARRPQTA